MALDKFDLEEPTRPGLHSEPVRRLRGQHSDDPWETLGNLMREMVILHRKLHEWTLTATHLNQRLSRIEKLLYGGAGSFALVVLEYLARKLGVQLLP